MRTSCIRSLVCTVGNCGATHRMNCSGPVVKGKCLVSADIAQAGTVFAVVPAAACPALVSIASALGLDQHTPWLRGALCSGLLEPRLVCLTRLACCVLSHFSFLSAGTCCHVVTAHAWVHMQRIPCPSRSDWAAFSGPVSIHYSERIPSGLGVQISGDVC